MSNRSFWSISEGCKKSRNCIFQLCTKFLSWRRCKDRRGKKMTKRKAEELKITSCDFSFSFLTCEIRNVCASSTFLYFQQQRLKQHPAALSLKQESMILLRCWTNDSIMLEHCPAAPAKRWWNRWLSTTEAFASSCLPAKRDRCEDALWEKKPFTSHSWSY